MGSQTNIQGNKSLAAVIHALSDRGFEVFIPLGDGTSIDLIVALPDGPLIRAQVKTGRVTTGKYSRRVAFNTSTLHWKKKLRTGYLGKADLFIAWCPETARCYCVPVRETGNSSFSISVDNPAPFDLETFDFDSIFADIEKPHRRDEYLETIQSPHINRNLSPSKQDRVRDYVARSSIEGFKLRDVRIALPDISPATIQLTLAAMRREGLAEMGPLSSLNTTWRTVRSYS